jgi:uncharacterized protein (DUF1778 family)
MATALPRITARVDAETQDLLAQAAAIAGMTSINSFVLNAAIDKAKQIMERERALKLSNKALEGIQPTLRQVPPKVEYFSIRAVLKPNCAHLIAAT